MKHFKERNRRKGSALITTLLLVGVLSAVMASILRYSVSERRVNHRHKLRAQADNTAEAVVEYGFAQLAYTFDNKTTVASNTFASGNSGALSLPAASSLRSNVKYGDLELYAGTVPNSSLVYIDPSEPDNMFDPMKGKYVRAFDVNLYGKATVSDPNGGPDISSYIGQRFQVRDSPLFSHAIFYNPVLDIHPGPLMDVYGPVHTNGNLRLAPVNGLTFHDIVTSAGHVYHHLEHLGPSSRTGHLKFSDGSGSYPNMEVNGVWMDSELGTGSISSGFRSYASNRWKGNLQTVAHGVQNYKPVAFADYEPDDPSTSAYDPENSSRAIIEPPLPTSHNDYNVEIETQKMSNKAGLYFKWDTTANSISAYDGDGNTLHISNLEGSLWEHKQSAFLDRRRGEYITTINIHTGKLKQLIENPDTSNNIKHIGGYDPSTDWNGVVYFESYSSNSDSTAAAKLNYTGIRLIGAETDVAGEGIPSRGLEPGMSFVTNNALYIQGHYNADGQMSSNSAYDPDWGEVPAAIMGDSITYLSENWDDSDTSVKPNASSTEVSAATVSGIRPSNVLGDGNQSGGNENFPRFLEKWSGNTFYLRGSMVCLYESEVDFSIWSTSYYSPPKRKYGFNNLFKTGVYPPGTPLLRTYRRDNFQDMTATEFASETSGL